MPAAALIGPAIGAGASIFSAIKGSKTAKEAAKIQSDAATKAAADLLHESERGSADIRGAGGSAADLALETGSGNQQALIKSGEEGRNRILEALKGLDGFASGGQSAFDRILKGLGEGGEFSTKFDYNGQDFLNDKGVQYRIAQGKKAIESSAARQGLIGGNTVRALEEQSQGIASDEYGKAFDRASGTFQMNRNNSLNPLLALSKQGQDAVGQQIAGNTAASQIDLQGNQLGANAIGDAVKTAGNFRLGSETDAAKLRNNAMLGAAGLTTDAAGATAAGKVGSTNAFLAALQSMGGSAGDLAGIDWSKLNKQKTGGDSGPGLVF